MGTPEIAVPTLAAVAEHHDIVAVVTQPDRRRGRGRLLEPSPVKQWALEHGVTVLQPETLRDAAARQQLADLGSDVAVVVAFGQILPAEVLAIPKLGCVNLHASLLPRHRGASPIHAAILAGDTTTGVSTMLMDEGLDTGPVLLRRETPVEASDTTATLGERLGRIGAELMVETLKALRGGSLRPEPQEDAAATITRLIRKQDGQMQWRAPANELERRVRAMQPWPVASTRWEGTRIRVWKARVLPRPAAAADSVSGTVIEAGERLVVACGNDTALEIGELQRPGGRRLPAKEFLRGFGPVAGSRLGTAAEATE
jgi:methionyl-tRNA formyltransferase